MTTALATMLNIQSAFGTRDKGALDEDEARRLFQQLIVAMDYCHQMGVVNRQAPSRFSKKDGLSPLNISTGSAANKAHYVDCIKSRDFKRCKAFNVALPPFALLGKTSTHDCMSSPRSV